MHTYMHTYIQICTHNPYFKFIYLLIHLHMHTYNIISTTVYACILAKKRAHVKLFPLLVPIYVHTLFTPSCYKLICSFHPFSLSSKHKAIKYIHTYLSKYICIRILTNICTCICTNVHTYIQMSICIQYNRENYTLFPLIYVHTFLCTVIFTISLKFVNFFLYLYIFDNLSATKLYKTIKSFFKFLLKLFFITNGLFFFLK